MRSEFGIHSQDMKSTEYLKQFDSQSNDGTLTGTSGDGYAHIWERPLPDPSGTTDPCSCAAADPTRSYSILPQGTGCPQEGYQYNLVGVPGTVETYRPSSGPGSTDESVELRRQVGPGQVYGNNTMARREVETTASGDHGCLATTVELPDTENMATT